MSRSVFYSLALSLAVLLPATARAQPVRLDLAKGGDVTRPAPAGAVDIVLVSLLPRQDYTVTVIERVIEIPALQPPSNLAIAAGGNDCAAVVARAEALSDQKVQPASEAAVGIAVEKIRADEKELKCKAEAPAINDAIAKTERHLGNYTIGAGRELVVTVSRKAGAQELKWSFTLQGESRGLWLTTFGLTMVPDRNQSFFTKATGDEGAGAYKITREQDPSSTDLKPVPSVFFTWLSRKNQERNWAVGWTGGLGLEGNGKPAVYGGFSGTYNWNLGIVTGAAFVPETRLNGRYRVDQTVGEDLGAEALHKTRAHLRWFVALTYRFGDNPFAPKAATENADKTKAKKN